MTNIYAILGLSPSASESDIQRAMKKLAESQKVTIEDLNKMKNTLLNPQARAAYDSKLLESNPELKSQYEQEIAQRAAEKAKLQQQQNMTAGKSASWGKLFNNPLVQGIMGNMSEISVDDLQKNYGQYLFNDEHLTMGYQLIRDMVLFTNQRIILIDKQGATGKKQSFISIYLSSIVDVSMETAGFGFDDSEITITYLSNVYQRAYSESYHKKKFEFPKSTDILPLYRMLGSIVLQNRERINN